MSRKRKARGTAAASGRTPPLERWLAHGSTVAVALTGVVFAWMKYLMEPPPDTFSAVNHPWQPAALHLHVLVAPLNVLAIGMLLRDHVLARLRDPSWKRSRRTGILVIVALLPLVASGYLLQTSTSEAWRAAWKWTHLATGGLGIVVYAAHVVAARAAGFVGRRGGGTTRADTAA